MDNLGQFLVEWGVAVWQLLADSAAFLILGFLLAGIIAAFVSERNLHRLIGRRRHMQVLRAALVGVPLPLCSCSVLPVAHQLRQTGLSKGATMSFLISTPESGVDSILLTYSLTDPLLTVARPVTAFVTAVAAGLIENAVESPEPPERDNRPEAPIDVACECGCPTESDRDSALESIPKRIWKGLRYAFTDIVDDLAIYLFVGYMLAGLASVVLGSDLIALNDQFRNGWLGYMAAVVVGLPMYICATSSTPLAAALLANGFSPGAILVFLIVGPATNIATLVVVGKMLEKWSLVRYLLTIVLLAILAGLLLDRVYVTTGASDWFDYAAHEHGAGVISFASAVIMTALILFYSVRKLVRRAMR